MTDFKVNPDDIDLAARALWKIAEDNAKAVSYANEWVEVEDNAGTGTMLKTVVSELQDTSDRLRANYERLGKVTDSSSTELTNAAKMYRATDARTAEAMDRGYTSKVSK
ncbi:type VII secretion target [Nocardia amikacinitolerans]|uniref:type VII secretion target n=1 Tax=Nocardia amikacinitolerans TaxID=756689 RepID=UPI00369347BC